MPLAVKIGTFHTNPKRKRGSHLPRWFVSRLGVGRNRYIFRGIVGATVFG
jgi:hypothetical protein